MQENKTEMANKKPKKANLLDHHSIKHILDESVSEIVKRRGIRRKCEDEQYKICLILDSGKYIVFNGLLQLIIHLKEKNAILATYPPKGSFTSTGLVVSSKLPRFSDEYTLTMASADHQSISAGKPVQFTKSVTHWFTKDGVLVEGLFWKDVEALLNDYAAEPKKS
ncbi:hypothetical protein OIU84_019732 [Salix udensis]|uniref:Signal peptidase complex subunit 2 n=1 Tax=Salix udensis TaxID=889485 RepID=A0AAD6PJE8_9ROSI|nr:hypothetical protein OIU84_019732 [Salix udensis]